MGLLLLLQSVLVLVLYLLDHVIQTVVLEILVILPGRLEMLKSRLKLLALLLQLVLSQVLLMLYKLQFAFHTDLLPVIDLLYLALVVLQFLTNGNVFLQFYLQGFLLMDVLFIEFLDLFLVPLGVCLVFLR